MKSGTSKDFARFSAAQRWLDVEQRSDLVVQIGRDGDAPTARHVGQGADATLDVVSLRRTEPGALRQTESHLKQLDEDGLTSLNGRTLIGKRTAEEGRDDRDGAGGDVVFQSRVGVFAVVSGRRAPGHIDQETAFK